jgi:SAM-dependent methyltransferase
MKCPICESDPVERFHSRYVQILKCGNCGHLYAENPAPDQGVQAMPDPKAAAREFGERNRRLVRRWRRDRFLSPGSRVLDIGSGAGHIVEAIRQEIPQTRIVCVESDPRGAAHLEARGFVVIDDLDAVPFRPNAVLLIEVVEHVNDPVTLLRRCGRVLDDDGRLFLTTPCGETRSGNRRTNAYDTPEHVHFFTERSLRLACERAGFRHIELMSPACMRPPGRGLRRALEPARSLARRTRDMLRGWQHLVCYVN